VSTPSSSPTREALSAAVPSTSSPESGIGNNSKELSYRQVFESLGVRPPWQVPPRVWRWCYHVHRFLLKCVLHLGDPLVVPNSSLSGLILWWKAFVGNDRRSQAYDRGWAGDLLPPATGWIAGRPISSNFRGPSLRRFFPRLNHANIELRTVYLNKAVDRVLQAWKQQKTNSSPLQANNKVRVVVLGAGYDLRGTRLLTEGVVDEVLELDLPDVIAAKQALWTRRLRKRRPNVRIPRFVPADLNDVSSTRELLLEQLRQDDHSSETKAWSTIFILEGILVHLKTEAGHELLKIMSSLSPSNEAALIFADALPYVTQRRLEEAQAEMQNQGWTLLEFVANPTKAPHMGIAIKS
jgi:Leucine carboxyl methyltransferase